MRSLLRKHVATIVVAFITAAVVAGPAGFYDGGGSSGSVAVAQTATNCPAPTVNNSPCTKYGFKDGPVVLTYQTLTTIAALPLGPGRYVINAKLYFGNQSAWAAHPYTAECQLVAGPNFDWAKDSIATTLDQQGQTFNLSSTMTLIVANRFTEAGAAELKCASTNSGVLRAHFIKITAQKVGTLIRVNM